MPQPESLHKLFVHELKDAYDAEKQLLKALRQMSGAATHAELANAFDNHLEETTGQIAILEEVFEMIGVKPKRKHCAGIAGIIEEGNEAIEESDKSPLLDAALVGGGRRAEHYEIAAYNTLIAMADELGYADASARLQEILVQEMTCDKTLAGLGAVLLPLAKAEGAAADGADEDDDEEDEDDEEDDDLDEDDADESLDDEDDEDDLDDVDELEIDDDFDDGELEENDGSETIPSPTRETTRGGTPSPRGNTTR